MHWLFVCEIYECVSASANCSLHRITSELSAILAPDPTPGRLKEVFEECIVRRKERKKGKGKKGLPVGFEPTTSC